MTKINRVLSRNTCRPTLQLLNVQGSVCQTFWDKHRTHIVEVDFLPKLNYQWSIERWAVFVPVIIIIIIITIIIIIIIINILLL